MKRDRIMNKLIPQFGDLHLRGHHDPFTTWRVPSSASR
jgi:DNA-3-methyladenine glycosylase II